ncbi:hypothetical protein GW17_00006501 [Ensete ventricosum]|nr:hypothetical protein GW17_00006501 [Ensete ventricosum]
MPTWPQKGQLEDPESRPACSTPGDWRHGRADEMGLLACSTPGDKAAGGMIERMRRADQPATSFTVDDWQHGRANATEPACSTPTTGG